MTNDVRPGGAGGLRSFFMGGFDTHTITLAHPEVFSYCGLLSGGTYTPEEIKDKSKVKLIFLSCSSKENADGVKKAATALKDAGNNAILFVSEGTAHEFKHGAAALGTCTASFSKIK